MSLLETSSYPAPRMRERGSSGVKQLVLSVVVVVVVVVIKKISLMGDLEAKTISKQEDKDEIRRILAYVYLVKQKVVLFSAFPRSF